MPERTRRSDQQARERVVELLRRRTSQPWEDPPPLFAERVVAGLAERPQAAPTRSRRRRALVSAAAALAAAIVWIAAHRAQPAAKRGARAGAEAAFFRALADDLGRGAPERAMEREWSAIRRDFERAGLVLANCLPKRDALAAAHAER